MGFAKAVLKHFVDTVLAAELDELKLPATGIRMSSVALNAEIFDYVMSQSLQLIYTILPNPARFISQSGQAIIKKVSHELSKSYALVVLLRRIQSASKSNLGIHSWLTSVCRDQGKVITKSRSQRLDEGARKLEEQIELKAAQSFSKPGT